LAITYSEAIDANGERRGPATEAASKAVKSIEFASLETTRSLTYFTLKSSLFVFGFWSRLTTAFSIQVLEREAEISKLLADVLNDQSTKPAAESWKQSIPRPTAADSSIREAARKAGDNVNLVTARIKDATKGVVAASSDANERSC
jgi:hypothetical protein